ncbi:MAG: 3'-5' exonuclease [Burkholderiales bacterium]|nr:3'-5' exonuclease [Burkholderiales bacterium]
METVAVIDFETTGISPGQGARATEIAAVLLRDGEIVGRFQSLMNAGAWIAPFIQSLTGISNAMIAAAPPARTVMREVMAFTRGCPMVAHNASFDRSFWLAEAAAAGCEPDPAHRFACTMLLARRVYPQAPNRKRGTLAALNQLPDNGRAHRALADAMTAAQLWMKLQRDLQERGSARLALTHERMCELQRTARGGTDRWLRQGAGRAVVPRRMV